MKNNIVPVILCSGSGTRVWPLSRGGFPKQILVLSGITSLFQQWAGTCHSVFKKSVAVLLALLGQNRPIHVEHYQLELA
jgi:mannose-1-phosphate guanylyltransferase/mannose-6-phosphate isomerase